MRHAATRLLSGGFFTEYDRGIVIAGGAFDQFGLTKPVICILSRKCLPCWDGFCLPCCHSPLRNPFTAYPSTENQLSRHRRRHPLTRTTAMMDRTRLWISEAECKGRTRSRCTRSSSAPANQAHACAPPARLLRTDRTHRHVKAESCRPDIQHDLDSHTSLPHLSTCQKEILQHIANGLTAKEVSKCIGIRPYGVNAHLRAIFNSLGAASRTEAVSIAIRNQMLKI